jgi:predicted nucleic acid-binding protein
VIIDTGVVISAFAFGATPKTSLTKALDKDLLEIKSLPFRLNILTPRMYLKKP